MQCTSEQRSIDITHGGSFFFLHIRVLVVLRGQEISLKTEPINNRNRGLEKKTNRKPNR